MKKAKKSAEIIESFTLDLTDAILLKSWPSDVPKILQLQTGQHEKSYDLLVVEEPWYLSLLKFVSNNQYTTKNKELPIGIGANSMPVGSKIFDSNNFLVAQGEDKVLYLAKLAKQAVDLEQSLVLLREEFPGIKDRYLTEFKYTKESLLKFDRSFKDSDLIFDIFSDLMMFCGGSTYRDGSLASLGAYNSLIDSEAMKCVLNQFKKEELVLLREATEDLSYLTPIHSIINGQVEKMNARPMRP